MKNIGPTFPNELSAAGLLGLPFSWSNEGELNFGDGMTEEQIAAVRSVYAAHDPEATIVSVSPLDKLKSFLAANPDVASILN